MTAGSLRNVRRLNVLNLRTQHSTRNTQGVWLARDSLAAQVLLKAVTVRLPACRSAMNFTIRDEAADLHMASAHSEIAHHVKHLNSLSFHMVMGAPVW